MFDRWRAKDAGVTEALVALGEVVNATDAGARRMAVDRILAAGTPPTKREPVWAGLLDQPGLNRFAALACFVAAASDVESRWRPRDPAVRRDWEGMWTVIVHGHEAEHDGDRWLTCLLEHGAGAAAADIRNVVTGIRARIDRQLATRRWEPDPDDPDDDGGAVSEEDVALLREGAAELDAWLPTLR